jgi:imidazolonepropionase-like amidohydrolase
VIEIAIERGFAEAELPRLTVPEVRALVSEAHERGLDVTAHVTLMEDTRRAL